MSEPVDLYIERPGNKFVIAFKDGELPESVAGRENILDIHLINNTDFNLSKIKILSTRKDVRVQYPEELLAHQDINGVITYECPEDEEGPFADINLVIQCEARKRGA